MNQSYKNLSELRQSSTQAEAFFNQLPERIQTKAMDQREKLHTVKELRAFAKHCAEEL